MTKIAIFPGTFDPLTLGHQDLILRAAAIFDQLVVAVAVNLNKAPLLSLQQRVSILKNTFGSVKNINVVGYSNLLVDFARAQKASVIVRSVRGVKDFEYELQLATMNKALSPNLETIFLTPNGKYAHVSSSFVKEIAQLGGDVSPFVNTEVEELLKSITWR